MRSLALLVLFVFAACGDDGGTGPGGNVDAPDNTQTDAPTTQMDAPTSTEKQLGSRCTPDQNNPQGDCPDGFLCLNLQGGSHPWCSKPCQSGAGDTCAMGYTGPGLANCFLDYMPPMGQTVRVCGVVCDDLTQGDSICPATKCNGMCPSMLMCTADLRSGNGTVVAKGCQ